MFAYLDLWIYDGTLDRMHHALYEACREQAGREASPTACIIDSHSSTAAMGRAARLWHHRRWMKPMELPHDPI